MITQKNPLTEFKSRKAENLLSDLNNKIINGTFVAEEDFIAEVVRRWQKIKNLQLTSDIVIPAYIKGALPIRKDLEDPLLKAAEELVTLHELLEEALTRSESIHRSFTAEITGLDKIIEEIQNKTTKLLLHTTDDTDMFLWSSDSFTSTDQINTALTNITINNGEATLKVKELETLNNYIKTVTIDTNGSVGVPGNNMEITGWTPTKTPDLGDEPDVTTVAQTDMHADIAYLLDNQVNTWYEWEYVYIPQKQKVQSWGAALVTNEAGSLTDIKDATKGYGWKKFIQWPGTSTWDKGNGEGLPIVDFAQQKTARLVLNITLDAPRKMSAIQITPHIIKHYPKILGLLISKDNEKWELIAENVTLTSKLNEGLHANRAGLPERNYSGIGIWTFPEREVQYIRISLEAGGSYLPTYGFGHQFYYRITEKHKSGGWFTKGKTWTEITRLPNPQTGVISNPGDTTQVSALGAVLGAAAGFAIKSLTPLAGAVIGSSLISAAFGGKVTATTKEEGSAYDIFAGTRSVIAIKDISLSKRTYMQQGQIITKAHNFIKPLNAISIISTEEIPKEWDTNTEWITFYVSADGYTWKHITPQNRSGGQNDVVFINSDTVYVKIIMTRPDDNIYETPVLKSFAIKGMPK